MVSVFRVGFWGFVEVRVGEVVCFVCVLGCFGEKSRVFIFIIVSLAVGISFEIYSSGWRVEEGEEERRKLDN